MPGQTRSKGGFSGGSGLVVNGYSGGAGSRSYNIEYCPYDEVDGQLDAFCDISKVSSPPLDSSWAGATGGKASRLPFPILWPLLIHVISTEVASKGGLG